MRIKLFHTGVSLFQWEYRVQRSLIPLKMDEDSILTMKYQKEIVISFSPHFIFHCKKVTKKRIFSNYLYLCLTYKRYNKTQCCAPCPFHAAPVEPGSPDQSIRLPPPPPPAPIRRTRRCHARPVRTARRRRRSVS